MITGSRIFWTLLTVAVAVISLATFAETLADPNAISEARVAADFRTYMAATERWVSGQPFYHEWQTDGPYALPDAPVRDYIAQPILYPPPALLLFLPFALLPLSVSFALWYAIPIAAIVWVIWRHRPRPWAWPVMAACALWAQSIWLLVAGNPAALWSTAGVALGTVYGWPALGALLRPTLAPLALIGLRRRSWWIGVLMMALVSLPFGEMWFGYVSVLANARGATETYILQHYVIAAVPLVAWWARSAPWRMPAMRLRRGPEPHDAVTPGSSD